MKVEPVAMEKIPRTFYVCSDSDDAGDPVGRIRVSGLILFVDGSFISRQSEAQRRIM